MKITANLLIIAILWSVLPAVAQTTDNRGVAVRSKNATTEKRLALVIGNSAYQNTSLLPNPQNDAADMKAALESLGFEVFYGVNVNAIQMEALIRQFGDKLAQNKGVGLFYYAGHGIASNGENYLVPIDADIPAEDEIRYKTVNLSFLLDKIGVAENSLNIVILDACRNNPFARKWRTVRDTSANGGLATITKAPTGTLIAYATAPGEVASDGSGKNGLYTQELLKQMKQPNLQIEEVFKNVRSEVRKKSKNAQVPWESSSIEGEFYFYKTISDSSSSQSVNSNQNIKPKPTPLPTPTPITITNNLDSEEILWNEISSRNNKSSYEVYLSEYPNGKYKKQANERISGINDQEQIRQNNIEKDKWDLAVQQNKKNSYSGYLMEYPNGEYSTLARKKLKDIENEETRIQNEIEAERKREQIELENSNEQAKWEEVSVLNRKNSYKAYLTIYPNGKYTSAARAKIKEFEDEEARVLQEENKKNEKEAWEKAESLKTVGGYEAYLRTYPVGNFGSLARLRLKDLGKTINKLNEIESKKPEILPNDLKIEFVMIKKGVYERGSEKDLNEMPLRQVKINYDFWMGKYEVTQEQYEKVVGKNPSFFKNCVKCPVENVSWNDAQNFIKKLNEMTVGFTYSLPSETEWEYTAKSEVKSDFYGEPDEIAWYFDNSNTQTNIVGSKSPNAFGIYDTLGNVWEWCEDDYLPNYKSHSNDGAAVIVPNKRNSLKVLRGGSWQSYKSVLRPSLRSNSLQRNRFQDVGFRLVAIANNK